MIAKLRRHLKSYKLKFDNSFIKEAGIKESVVNGLVRKTLKGSSSKEEHALLPTPI